MEEANTLKTDIIPYDPSYGENIDNKNGPDYKF
jgi:hypothetical protein